MSESHLDEHGVMMANTYMGDDFGVSGRRYDL